MPDSAADEGLKSAAAATYAATADHFDDPALSFWDRYGERTGGRLAVTFWGPGFVEPATEQFWAAVGRERPELVGGFHPWTRVTDPDRVARLFALGGTEPPEVEAEAGTQPLTDPADRWTIVLGTGDRATVEQLGAEAADRVRRANVDWLRRAGVRELQTNVVYAVARKPERP